MARKPPFAPDPESGSASVLAVSGVGILAVTAMLSLGGRVVVERRAVEDSIAEMRAYWAAMGHATYALSRVRYNTNVGTPPAGGIAKQAATEISDGGGASLNASWRYPDVSADYIITVLPTAPGPDAATGAAAIKSRFDFNTCIIAQKLSRNTNAPEALRAIAGLRSFEFDYCVTSSPTDGCTGNPDKNYWRESRIYRVTRPANGNKNCG